MLDKTARRLPVTVEDPGTVRTGEPFLTDLATLGPWKVSTHTLVRAVCTLGERHRAFNVTEVVVADRVTAFLEYNDEKQYQIELLADGEGVTESTVKQLKTIAHANAKALVVVLDGTVTADARTYCDSHPDLSVLDATA